MQRLALVLLAISLASADIEEAFKASKLIPNVLSQPPLDVLEVKYGEKSVDLGTELTPTETQQIPEIHYKHVGGVLYTLIMTDADAVTGRGYNREYQHWVVGNIPEENVAKGEVLSEYVGPAAAKNTGKHRYVFLIYKQNQGAITFDERRLSNRDGQRRSRFSTKRFTEKYDLEGPIAGNFFVSEYDENVPHYRKLLALP